MTVFAFEDDYEIGVLSSSIHREWARIQGSTLRVDIRYTPSTSFGTFPWADASEADRAAVAEFARAIVALRQAITTEHSFGLTRLYNLVEDGAFVDLRRLHEQLDEAVAGAYGWSRTVASNPDESNRLLLDRNLAISSGEIDYAPFGFAAAAD